MTDEPLEHEQARSVGAVDLVFLLGVGLAAFLVFRRTLAPGPVELFDDTLEFPLVVDRLAVAHPTGYPLYIVLGKLFSLIPVGELAYRLNLMSALFASLAVVALTALVGEIMLAGGRRTLTDRLAAAVGALTLAFSQVFWSQAVIAEVYSFSALLTLATCWAVLRAVRQRSGTFVPALLVGLGLAHHRTGLLAIPALAAYAGWSIWVNRNALAPSLRSGRRWIASLWPALLPLLLYLYIPIRAGVGSIDGTYRNDLMTFLRWVSGAGYAGFLSENSLARQGNPAAAYWSLLVDQFGGLGLLLAALGVVFLLRRSLAAGCFVLLWWAPSALFAILYRAPDVEVFALPSFLPVAVVLAAGIAAVGRILPSFGAGRGPVLRFAAQSVSFLIVLIAAIIPIRSVAANYEETDLSNETTVRSYGIDALNAPLPASSGIVALLGEASLFQYLQRAEGLRPDIQVRHADDEMTRLDDIEQMLAEGRNVFVTRPLPGLAERYHLGGVGPLISVETNPSAEPPPGIHKIGRTLGDVELIGYTSEIVNGYGLGPGGPSDLRAAQRSVRVTLYWRALNPIEDDLRSFVHLDEPLGDRWAQSDRVPVNGAYRTRLWRPGLIIADVHDLALPLGTPAGDYVLQAGLAHADGQQLLATTDGAREIRLDRFSLDSRPGGYTRRRLDLEPRYVPFGPISLIGERIQPQDTRPAAMLTMETLWRAERDPSQSMSFQAELANSERTISLGSGQIGGRLNTFRWLPGDLVRDRQSWRLPADLPDGRYQVRISVGDSRRQSMSTISVTGRQHVYTLPDDPMYRSGARLGGRAELAGWSTKQVRIDEMSNALEVALYWRSSGPLDLDYSVFVHLAGADRAIVAQHDGPPADGLAPTASWLTNEVIVDRHIVRVPSNISLGTLRLSVGLYDPKSGRRLAAARGEQIDLGLVR